MATQIAIIIMYHCALSLVTIENAAAAVVRQDQAGLSAKIVEDVAALLAP